MARRTDSVWAMLLWKEWRQQWVTVLLVAICCLGGYAAYCRVNQWQGDGYVLVGLSVLASLSLGTSVFAGEFDDRTSGFLDRLPVPAGRLLVVKYVSALALALLCLVVPTLATRPRLGAWILEVGETPLDYSLLVLVTMALLLASTTVAVTGALARLGLGSMATWLTTGAWGIVTVVVPFAPVMLRNAWLCLFTMAVIWCVVHAWLGYVWLFARTRQTLVCWILPLLVPITPVVSGSLWLAHQRTCLQPTGEGGSPRWSETKASPSPDGRHIVITRALFSPSSGAIAATWLADPDTGETSRMGSPWRNCSFWAWTNEPASWSPDGSEVRLYVGPALTLWYPQRDWYRGPEEWLCQVGKNASKVVSRRSSRNCHWSRWLQDGTNANWTPTAWEFTDPATGEIHRCLHPPEGDPTEIRGRRAWLDSAVVTVSIDRGADGKSWLYVWRSAPELAKTERRDFLIDPAFVDYKLRPGVFSKDGRWLVLAPVRNGPQEAIGLLSLVDGTSCLLKPPDGYNLEEPIFTPDSGLLIVPSIKSLQVWNMGTQQWETGIDLSPWLFPPDAPTGTFGLSIAISPTPPWRVAVGANGSGSVYLADLAQQTVTEVFATGNPGTFGWWWHVAWLGNNRLLAELQGPYRLWVVNADGSGSRQVLP